MDDINIVGEYYDAQRRHINDKVVALGRIPIVILITLIATLLAIGMTYVLIQLFAETNFSMMFALKIAAFIPVVITPVLAWPLVGSYLRLISMERALYLSATYDMLTGFLSRNAFFSHLQIVHDLTIRNKSPLSVASIDIDEFKKINDSYGHAAGDEVLRMFGDLVKNTLRKSDFVGRVGGDEFVLVLPYTGVAEAGHVLENIRALAANTPVNIGETKISFTISIGLTQVDAFNPILVDELLTHSDKALYQAKKSGKNCVVAKNVTAFA